ncbi:MAG: hypothetical protein FJY07_13930 [Bacteroidetes bacterium]|nr:hypothetical protein [Bacteroidota bacterium]
MKYIITFFLIITGLALTAQREISSAGLRSGGISGISIKLINDDLSGMEIIAGVQRNGFKLTGLIHKYKPIEARRIANLYMYSGLGAHAGFERYTDEKTKMVDGVSYYSHRKVVAPIIGGDLNVGLEYHFESVPFQVSLDYKPYFELFGRKIFRLDLWDIGFTVRYVINK